MELSELGENTWTDVTEHGGQDDAESVHWQVTHTHGRNKRKGVTGHDKKRARCLTSRFNNQGLYTTRHDCGKSSTLINVSKTSIER